MASLFPLLPSLRRNLHWWGYVAVALLTLALLQHLMPSLLAHPNDYFLEKGGDGIQSYFATAYYVLYDQGVHFSGMNYPYGEHINYPNMQPLLAWVMGVLQRHGVPAGRYTIGITNAVALAGLAATPLVMYALLRRFRLPVGYAVLMALITTFMSPQLMRLGAHISLSYAFFVPLLWYFIIRMQETPRAWRWYVWFVVSSMLMGGMMLYFTAAGSLLLLAHVAVLAWQRRHPGPLLWRMAAAALLPLLLFRSWLWLTDPIVDRPPNPYGVLVYMATPAGMVTPIFAPLHDIWQALWPAEPMEFESQAYVGLVCTGVLLVSVLLGLWQLGRLKWRRGSRRLLRPAVPAPLAAALWAASLVLLYAFGYPFKWPWLTWTLDYAGPLKQFRALGRFAWPFYYVLSVYAAYCLYRLWRYQRLHRVPVRALPWLPLLLALWAFEAWTNLKARAEAVTQASGADQFLAPNPALVQRLSWKNRTPASFQAILPLPYYNKGSDRIDITGSTGSIFNGEYLACATGLPLLATYVSRPSVGQMLRHVQLLGSPLVEKTLLRDFPNRKPILLMVATDRPLQPAEQRLVSLAQPLLATPDMALYELPVAALAATSLVQEYATATALLPGLPERPGGLRCTTGKGVLLQSYDQSPDRRSRLGGGGAFYEPKQKFSRLYVGPLPTPADTGRYEISVWVNSKTDYGYGDLQINLSSKGQFLAHLGVGAGTATEISGDWLRVSFPFRRGTADQVEVIYNSRDLLADDLLIRPLDTDVYYYVGQGSSRQLIKNGYVLHP